MTPPLSKARRAGAFLFISGQLPRGADGGIVAGDIAVQTTQALNNLKAVLEANGGRLDQVVKVTAWLTDPALFEGFNRAYADFFSEPYPTRSTVVGALVAVGAAVEIEAVAFLG